MPSNNGRSTVEHCLHARGLRELRGKEHFSLWFCNAPDYKTQLQRSRKNFKHHILKQDLEKHIGSTQDKTALEIGFGGGRLIIGASPHFREVVGLDIHNAFDYTEEILKEQNVTNHRLLHVDQRDTVEDKSIDFAFSFLVFSHLPSWEAIEDYFIYLKRVMKDRSAGIIYFGLLDVMSNKDYELDLNRRAPGWWQSIRTNPNFVCREASKYFDVICCEPYGDQWMRNLGIRQAQYSIQFVNKGSGKSTVWPLTGNKKSVFSYDMTTNRPQLERAMQIFPNLRKTIQKLDTE